MNMTDLKAYVRFNGTSWEYQIEDGYSSLVTKGGFEKRTTAEIAARIDVSRRVEANSKLSFATDWERITL